MSVGTSLREERQRLGMDLAEIAHYLRIRLEFLEAIENEDPQQLPGGAYAIGFVKTYAKTLGLDPIKVADAFRKEQADAMRKVPLRVRMPLSESRVPTTGLIVLVLVLATSGWIGWSWFAHGQIGEIQAVSSVPDRLKPHGQEITAGQNGSPGTVSAASATDNAVSTAPSGPEATSPLSQPAAPVGEAHSQDSEPDEAVNDSSGQEQTPAMRTTPPAQAANGTAFGAPVQGSRVGIRALSDSWVQIRDPSHAAIYTGILHTGDLYRLPDVPGYSFTTGNAGGIELQVDGKEGQALGAVGQVLRDLPVPASKPQ